MGLPTRHFQVFCRVRRPDLRQGFGSRVRRPDLRKICPGYAMANSAFENGAPPFLLLDANGACLARRPGRLAVSTSDRVHR